MVDVVRHEISDKMRLPIFGSPYPIACFPAGAHGPKCEAEGTPPLHPRVLRVLRVCGGACACAVV